MEGPLDSAVVNQVIAEKKALKFTLSTKISREWKHIKQIQINILGKIRGD